MDSTESPPPPSPEGVVRRFIDEVLNGGDLDALPELWAADLVWHGGSMGDTRGLAAFTRQLASARSAFSGMHLQVDDLVAAGNTVAVRFTNRGTHSGPFMGAEPTGRAATWSGIGMYTVAGHRITEAWFGEDILGLLLQLDVISLPTL